MDPAVVYEDKAGCPEVIIEQLIHLLLVRLEPKKAWGEVAELQSPRNPGCGANKRTPTQTVLVRTFHATLEHQPDHGMALTRSIIALSSLSSGCCGC